MFPIHLQKLRIAAFLFLTVVAIGGFWFCAGPVPQIQSYYDFADQRPMLGMPHALNVLSNLPFIVVGVLGTAYLCSERSRRPGVFLEPMERRPYWVYFIGLVLTGIGSSYFHANPTNATLTWDRAALAITFMALFTSILAERVHPACARWALVPLVLFGIGSVFYWDYSERVGAGDLRFYLIVQFFPLFILPLLLIFYPPRYTHGGDLLASLLCYGLAKALEILDRQVYTGAGFVSGHTLKHMVAGLAAAFILLMLLRRQPRTMARQAFVLAPMQGHTPYEVKFDLHHPNTLGHRLIAERLYAEVIAQPKALPTCARSLARHMWHVMPIPQIITNTAIGSIFFVTCRHGSNPA